MLDTSPLEFLIEQYGWQCKLGFRDGDWAFREGRKIEEGKYLFWVNDTLATTLP